jgi:site-specific recombinase XerD
MRGTSQLVARLLYGTGMRLLEGFRLRVKDLHFDSGALVVRSGKGNKHRTTTLPRILSAALRQYLDGVRALHDRDVTRDSGESGYRTRSR